MGIVFAACCAARPGGVDDVYLRFDKLGGIFGTQVIVPAKVTEINREIFAFAEASALQFTEKEYIFAWEGS